MIINELTQSTLKKHLHYEPSTGIFTWRLRTSYRIHIGDQAGYIRKTGYRRIRLKGKHYPSHRLAFLYMTGEMPRYVAHRNRVRADDSWENLQVSDQLISRTDRAKPKNTTSGFVGVSHDKRFNKWVARISVKGINKFLGRHDKKKDAVKARAEANIKYSDSQHPVQ